MATVKNKHETKQRLISAVGEILAESGFSKIGINAIARKAGVDKVLIYRYFEDCNGLIKAYAQSADFWPTIDELIGVGSKKDAFFALPFVEKFNHVFERYCNAIRSRPLTIEILAWETIERNAITIELENVRTQTFNDIAQNFEADDAPPYDWQAISTIFSAAIHYLAIRARNIKNYNEIDIASEHGWQRLLEAMRVLVMAPNKE